MIGKLNQLKRPIESYHKAWLGAVALVVIAASVAAVLLVGGAGIGKTRYYAEFAQAASLRAGDQVTVAGISVGQVQNLELAGDRVLVTFQAANDLRLGRDTQAAIKLTTLLGSRYLELSPAGPEQLENDTIPLAATSVPYNLQQTLADATTTFDQIDADRITQSMTTLTQGLAGVPEALPDALANLGSLSTQLAGRREQLRTLLTSTDTVTAMIRDQQASLGSLVVQGRNLMQELTQRREALQRLFAGATELVDSLSQVLDKQPGLNDLLTSMHELTRMIAAHDALFRNILQTLPIPVRNLANVTGTAMAADGNFPAGIMVDSWMCAISGRAEQFNLTEYFQDCQ